MRQVQRDGGEQPGQTSAEKARIKGLEREVRELRPQSVRVLVLLRFGAAPLIA